MNEYGIVYENVDLKKYTTLGVGGIAKYLIEVTSENNLVSLIKYLKDNKIKYFILGNGSNVILDDSYFDGVIIRVNKLNKIEVNDDLITASCGVKLGFLNNIALQHGLVSLYFASLIPGEVGASVMGNAGCYNHSLMENVDSIFKNPEGFSAGKLIDDLGLKGYHINDAYVSEKHANFIVNKGNATYLDILNLINYIKLKVFEHYKISLEVEPKIISWSNL